MPTPEFAWKTYVVPVRRADGRALEAADEQVREVHIPDFTQWPAAIDKARVLLETAAEVEHALLVQYLYAAFSLKSSEELTDVDQQSAVTTWSGTLHRIARQEMGHLMTVQNLLLALGHPPNFEREDFPPRKDLYPFTLHLEPLSQRSLSKYVAAESPADASGIDDILELATKSVGAAVNHVGTIYGLLALVFSTREQVEAGGSGSAAWDEILQRLAAAADLQNPDVAAWHLPDGSIDSTTVDQQGAPSQWQRGNTVHVITDRASAIEAIRNVAEEGEGLVDGEDSHFSRFLAMFRGDDSTLPFPAAGEWVPIRQVATDPRPEDIAEARTRRYTQLADIRYGILLGEIEHHLRITDTDDRATLASWAFEDMFGLADLARSLAALPVNTGVGCLPFTLPTPLPLSDAEAARWEVLLARLTAAIEKIEEMQAADPVDAADGELADLLSGMRARRDFVTGHSTGPSPTTSFARDILPLFRPVDIEHMNDQVGLDLADYDVVRLSAAAIANRIKRTGAGRMPPPPDAPLTSAQTALFDQWVAEGSPR